ncbi:MAG: hypothetical protein AAGJ82_05500 [Bacteroidota bacterium]
MPTTHQNYVSDVAQGIYSGAVGTILFAVFMVLFLYLAPDFLLELQSGTGMADVFVFMKGVAVSLIGAYLTTRYVDMRLKRKPEWAKLTQAVASSF